MTLARTLQSWKVAVILCALAGNVCADKSLAQQDGGGPPMFEVFGGPPPEQAQLAGANARFGFKLLKELVKDRPGNNVFISPYGASTLLQMVLCMGIVFDPGSSP